MKNSFSNVEKFSSNIAGDLKLLENKVLDIFTDHIKIVNIYIWIWTDHVYIKKSLMEDVFNNKTVENINFSDPDAVRIQIEKNTVNVLIFP